jgi:gamma-butyrobetaine dioxygenase
MSRAEYMTESMTAHMTAEMTADMTDRTNSSGHHVSVNILNGGSEIALQWHDKASRYHAIWLRDNGQDENTRNQANHQKLITIGDIPETVYVENAVVIDDHHLKLGFGPDQWTTTIDLDWLHSHRYDRQDQNPDSSPFADNVTTWDSDFLNNITRSDYNAVLTDPEALLKWLRAVDRYGVAILSGLPEKNAAVLDVIDLFGYTRETNYGEYFEIRSETNPINLAYTSIGLQSHTDNPYRDPVPGLQLFGCLENNADGGESVVVDGFRVAEIIRQENPQWFDLLSSYNAQFEYHGSSDAHLRASRPMIECGPNGKIIHIRFNNRSCTALTEIPYDHMEEYYRAYRRFGDLVNSNQLEVIFKLEPGQLFITDNTRVLHGRTGFSGSGSRWMQGAYADKDSLKSKIRVLEQSLNSTQQE